MLKMILSSFDCTELSNVMQWKAKSVQSQVQTNLTTNIWILAAKQACDISRLHCFSVKQQKVTTSTQPMEGDA